jgi:uncharacterized membrane protein YbaN (DUF454 family)
MPPCASALKTYIAYGEFCRKIVVTTKLKPETNGVNEQETSRPGASDPAQPPTKSKPFRVLLIGAGIGCVCLGVLGIFLPIMPTTVFLLLAATCFIRSSDRLYGWLISHRVLGTYIKAAQGKSGMPLKAKITMLAVLWITILYSTFFFARQIWLQAILLAIAAGVSVFILTRKTLKPDEL